MTVVTRIGNILKLVVSLLLGLLAVFTEAAKVAAAHLDAFVDDLGQSEIAKPEGTVTNRLGEITRGVGIMLLSVVAIGTEILKLFTKHLDEVLDELNEKLTVNKIPKVPK